MTAPAFAPPRGRRPSIEWVPLADLAIDESYQRSIDTKASQRLIAGIAAAWDWDVLDVLKVSRRPDDRLFVVDGQHRLAAARARGDIPDLPCVLKRCAGPADEARLFIAANRGRKPMSRLDDFRAAVGAGDEAAATIEALVVAAGLSIARAVTPAGQAPGELIIVAPLRRALALRGAAVVGRALALMGEAFGGEAIVGASPLFGALVSIAALTDLTDAQLLAALRTGTSQDWVDWAGAPTGSGGENRVIAMRAAIECRARGGLTGPPPGATSPASPPARQPASPPARQLAAAPAVPTRDSNSSSPSCGPAAASSRSGRSAAPTPTGRSAASLRERSDVSDGSTRFYEASIRASDRAYVAALVAAGAARP